MAQETMDPERFRRIFILVLALAISAVFFQMIRGLFLSVLLAGIFAGMTYPLYKRLTRWFRGREILASIATILVVLVLIIVPFTGFLGIVAAEAVEVAQGVAPWVERQIAQPSELEQRLLGIPFAERLAPYHDQIAVKLAEFAGNVGTFLVNTIAAGTKGTALFFFQLFVMLYAMFFFLLDGDKLLKRILYLMPMTTEQEIKMVKRFTSVARATIKGTLVIGIVQGGLAGLAFAVVGLKGAAFWGTIMAVLSIIPGVGTALVWVPAVVYLMAIGRFTAAILLFIWCAAVVGTVDNLLRPRLVGKDTKMPDLLILLGTIGGLVLFGAVGIIIGPIVAALFVTVWDIYGEAFKDFLPEVNLAGSGETADAKRSDTAQP
jgi:predicted PurR-regulated permease PerM